MITKIIQRYRKQQSKSYILVLQVKEVLYHDLVLQILQIDEITFDLRYYNASANTSIYLAKNGVLAAGGQHVNVSNTNTLVLNVNDYIAASSSADSSIDAIVTYEESDV